jgi:hypothetical protein
MEAAGSSETPVHVLQTKDSNSSLHILIRTKFRSQKDRDCVRNDTNFIINPFKDEAQTALFKDPVRTAQ